MNINFILTKTSDLLFGENDKLDELLLTAITEYHLNIDVITSFYMNNQLFIYYQSLPTINKSLDFIFRSLRRKFEAKFYLTNTLYAAKANFHTLIKAIEIPVNTKSNNVVPPVVKNKAAKPVEIDDKTLRMEYISQAPPCLLALIEFSIRFNLIYDAVILGESCLLLLFETLSFETLARDVKNNTLQYPTLEV